MKRLALVSISIVLLGAAGFLLSLNGCGGGSSVTFPPPPGLKIQHVVIIFQENRTPDNLFQGLCIPPYGSSSACSTNPSASQYDIAASGVDSTGATITLSPIDLGTAAGACAMEGAGLIPASGKPTTPPVVNCPPPADPQFMYVYPNDVAPY